MRDFVKKGSHTWDIIIEYHRCPDCGKIQESRKPYEAYQGRYIKELTCPRCSSPFTIIKDRLPANL